MSLAGDLRTDFPHRRTGRVPHAGAGGALSCVGIDLRSGPRYPTGLATMDSALRCSEVRIVRTDDEMLDAIRRVEARVVAIDAPLALPEGRNCTDPACPCASAGIMREVDRIAAREGYRPFPALLPSMVNLTLRGIALRERLEAEGFEVIEVFPGMTQDVLSVPRKRLGVDGLRRGLKRHGVVGLPRGRRLTHDELDAVTCALTGQFYLAGLTETMGSGLPVPLVLPDRSRTSWYPSQLGAPAISPRSMSCSVSV